MFNEKNGINIACYRLINYTKISYIYTDLVSKFISECHINKVKIFCNQDSKKYCKYL